MNGRLTCARGRAPSGRLLREPVSALLSTFARLESSLVYALNWTSSVSRRPPPVPSATPHSSKTPPAPRPRPSLSFLLQSTTLRLPHSQACIVRASWSLRVASEPQSWRNIPTHRIEAELVYPKPSPSSSGQLWAEKDMDILPITEPACVQRQDRGAPGFWGQRNVEYGAAWIKEIASRG